MLRLIKYLVSYYRVYRMNEKLRKANFLRAKRDLLLTILQTKYANEAEFFERVTSLNRKIGANVIDMRTVAENYEKSREISKKVVEAIVETPVGPGMILSKENVNGSK